MHLKSDNSLVLRHRISPSGIATARAAAGRPRRLPSRKLAQLATPDFLSQQPAKVNNFPGNATFLRPRYTGKFRPTAHLRMEIRASASSPESIANHFWTASGVAGKSGAAVLFNAHNILCVLQLPNIDTRIGK
jgi:hypothetical protein